MLPILLSGSDLHTQAHPRGAPVRLPGLFACIRGDECERQIFGLRARLQLCPELRRGQVFDRLGVSVPSNCPGGGPVRESSATAT